MDREKIDSFEYFKKLRTDVLEAVPVEAQRILSVGCAAGVTEYELIKRGSKVVGIEINHQAAELARKNGVIVFEGDASDADVTSVYDSFDCLVYADVLEHLRDPLALLKKQIKFLVPGGTVYIAVPNFRHYSIFWQLFVNGKIEYEEAGILDRTHLIITTRKMAQGWFDALGIKLTKCNYMMWGRKYKIMSKITLGLFQEFLAAQVGLIGIKK